MKDIKFGQIVALIAALVGGGLVFNIYIINPAADSGEYHAPPEPDVPDVYPAPEPNPIGLVGTNTNADDTQKLNAAPSTGAGLVGQSID